MIKNIGTMEALIRITCGLTGLSWSTAKMANRSNCRYSLCVAMMSAMKVAEGITRYCPLKEAMGLKK